MEAVKKMDLGLVRMVLGKVPVKLSADVECHHTLAVGLRFHSSFPRRE